MPPPSQRVPVAAGSGLVRRYLESLRWKPGSLAGSISPGYGRDLSTPQAHSFNHVPEIVRRGVALVGEGADQREIGFCGEPARLFPVPNRLGRCAGHLGNGTQAAEGTDDRLGSFVFNHAPQLSKFLALVNG